MGLKECCKFIISEKGKVDQSCSPKEENQCCRWPIDDDKVGGPRSWRKQGNEKIRRKLEISQGALVYLLLLQQDFTGCVIENKHKFIDSWCWKLGKMERGHIF